MRKIDLFTRTGRFYDASIFESRVPIDIDDAEVFIEGLDCGKSSKKLYYEFLHLLKSEEKKIGSELQLNLREHTDFNKYLFTLVNVLEKEQKYYFVADQKMYEHFNANIPLKTIRAADCANIDGLVTKYSTREISALTRIFEDDDWREREFKFIKSLSIKDYEAREITYFSFDSKAFTEAPNFTKIVWDDKICGSIFGFSYLDCFKTSVPFLRTASEFLHFYYELRISGSYVAHILSEHKCQRFSVFLENKILPNDIFDPHALSEASAWKSAIVKLFDVFPHLSDVWNKKDLKMFSNEKYILSNNIIDYIRALSSCRFPDICAVSSIIMRYEILARNYTNRSIDASISKDLDKPVIDIAKLNKRVFRCVSTSSHTLSS